VRTRIAVFIGAIVLGMLLGAAPAFAYNEGGSVDASRTGCVACHAGDYRQGPHGGYANGTNKCETCHSVHAAPANGASLLPAASVRATCEACHDGTGGSGVYGAIAARGLAVGGGHRIDTTNTVPAGDRATGGSAVETFTGTGGRLTCDDCHSPHDSKTVRPFTGDRLRTAGATTVKSDHLLLQRPTGSSYAVTQYGSDWCGSCHRGAVANSSGHHTHPVETAAVAGFYTYDNVPSVVSTISTATVLASLGRSNLGYVMPDPRTPLQQGHLPLCQQCHSNSRSVGVPGAAKQFTVTAPDGANTADNPRFQGFPHETVNRSMLVETGDDLCVNCHPVSNLP
jgi:hypothetical protein